MLEATSWVPCAACWMLRAISLVAEPCSSIAEAIAMPIWSISVITSTTFLIAATVSSLALWIAATCSEISVVALAVWPASDFTSEATTAKPLPASPARAASMVAFNASRLVCAAMVWISVTTSPIFCAPAASDCAISPVRRALSTARAEIWADCATWRLISVIEEVSSSVALATVCTLAVVCCEALATAPAWRSVAAAVDDIEPVGEAVSNTELFRRLAARMGFTEECFTRTDEQMMAEAFDWSAPAMEGITLDSLGQSGWARLNLPSPDEYAPHAEGNFPTPSGKVEFRSSIAEQAGNFVVPLFRQLCEEYQPGGTVDPLPYYVPPRETGATGYRLSLISPKSHAYLNSSAGDQPAQRRVQGEQAVTVHSRDAAERGITDGQYVRVHNDRGQFIALAQVRDDIAPGVVMAPMGAWRKNAKGHATVNAVNPFAFADLGNAPTFSDTRVEIELAQTRVPAPY